MLVELIGVLMLVPSAGLIVWHVFCWLSGRDVGKRTDVGRGEGMVSVLLPTRGDPPELLDGVVESVASLDWPKDRLELVVVSDDPGQRGREVSRIVGSKSSQLGLSSKVMVREAPVGKRCGALNEAFRECRGEYVMLIDMDNKPHPLTLLKAEALLRGGDAACVSRWVSYAYLRTRISTAVSSSMDFFGDSLHRGRAALGLFVFPISGVVYKRKVLEEVGLWDANVPQDDMWMGVKMIASGFSVGFSDDTPIQVLVPHSYAALRVQQAKWAYGISDVLRKGTMKVLRAKGISLLKRLEALLYLCQLFPPACTLLGTFLIAIVSLLRGVDAAQTLVPALAIWWALDFAEGFAFVRSQLDRGMRTGDSLFALGRNVAILTAFSPTLLIMGLKGLLGMSTHYAITPKGADEPAHSALADMKMEAANLALLACLSALLIMRGAIATASVVLWTALPFAYVLVRFTR